MKMLIKFDYRILQTNFISIVSPKFVFCFNIIRVEKLTHIICETFD